MEVWRSIPNFDGYEASDLGRIRSLKTDRILSLRNTNGYQSVSLCRGGKVKGCYVQRLVLQAFVGLSDLHACHINGLRGDNRLVNLRWDTRAGNMADLVLHGLDRRGSRHFGAKLTEDSALEIIRRVWAGQSRKSVAAAFGVNYSTVSELALRRSWRHLSGISL